MKFKCRALYIISIICSFYISYLICRLHPLSTRAVISITVFVTCIFLFITYLYKKNIDYSKLTKRNFLIMLILSICISIIVIQLNFNFFTKTFKETTIEIYSDEEMISDNNIKNIIIDNMVYTISGNQLLNNGVLVEDSETIIENNNEKMLIKVPQCMDIKVIFNPTSNVIHIQDGSFTKDILEFDEESYTYTVQSNVITDSLYVIRLILSELILIYIIFSTIVLLKCIRNPEKRYFIVTMIITIIGMWFYYSKYEIGILFPDSVSYIKYKFREALELKLQGRTPIYPILIRICKVLFDDYYIQAIIGIQYIIWFISIIFLFKMLKLLIKNINIVTIFTILYALCPAIIGWNNIVLTESIALSATVIIVYYIIRYIKKPKLSTAVSAIIISLILTFHRPTAIIYVVFLEVFWIGRFIFDRENIKIDFKCFIISTISILIIIIYAAIFNKTFGFYSISDAVTRQDLIVCIQEGYYKSSNNEQFIKDVDEALVRNIDTWPAMIEVKDKYGDKEIKKITNYCRKQNISQYFEYISDLAKEHQTIQYYSYLLNMERSGIQRIVNTTFSIITFSHVYVIMGIEFILIIYKWIKYKKVPWIHCGLFGFPFVIVFSSFIGTCSEFMRTSICCLPFAYVSIAIYANMISQGKKEKNNDRIIEEE